MELIVTKPGSNVFNEKLRIQQKYEVALRYDSQKVLVLSKIFDQEGYCRHQLYKIW